MAASVAREEGDMLAGEGAQDVIVRGVAEGSLDDHLLRCFKSGHGVEPAAADDSDFCFQVWDSLKRYSPRRHRDTEKKDKNELTEVAESTESFTCRPLRSVLRILRAGVPRRRGLRGRVGCLLPPIEDA